MNNKKLKYQLEEFKEMRHNAFITALELKNEGKYIAGIYGVNVPREILWAMDIVPVNIFGIDGSNVKAAEEFIDKNSCSLLKASYGYVITDRCPFSHFADIIIGTNYCFDKKCMLHKLENIKHVYIINEHNNVTDLVSEYKNFICFLEQKFNIKLDENKLIDIVKKMNVISKVIQEITDIYMLRPDIMGCNDLISIVYGSQFIFDLDQRLNKLQQLKETLNMVSAESAAPSKTGNILITGVPLAGLNDDFIKPLSSLNKAILTVSYCEGENYNIIDEAKDMYYGLAHKYLPENTEKNLNCIVSKYNIKAIVNVTTKGCNLKNKEYNNSGLSYFSATVDYNCDYSQVIMQVKLFINQ